MRFLHIFVAIGIAMLANAVEPAWLGFLVLVGMLGGYSWLAIRMQKRKKN